MERIFILLWQVQPGQYTIFPAQLGAERGSMDMTKWASRTSSIAGINVVGNVKSDHQNH